MQNQLKQVYQMDASSQKLRQNIQQQTKRLLSQLQELDTLKQELTQEQYKQLSQSTLQQLQIFQQSLQNMIKDPTNSLLQSQLQKTKRLIFQTIKQKFNKDQIKSKILQQQVKGVRNQIAQLDKGFHLKQVNPKEYMKRRRNLVVRLEQAGIQLTKQQSEWLRTNQNFTQKNQTSDNYENVQESQLKIVQQNIKKDF